MEERRIVTRSFFPNGTLRSRSAQERGSDAAPQRTYTYQYNANHLLTKVEERLAGTAPEAPPDDKIDIDRDAADRVVRVDPPSAQGKKNTEFAYDRDGNVIDRRVDGGGGTSGDTYSFRYDALGRETHTFFHNVLGRRLKGPGVSTAYRSFGVDAKRVDRGDRGLRRRHPRLRGQLGHGLSLGRLPL